jgi:multidrug efflux system outer membrane protein
METPAAWRFGAEETTQAANIAWWKALGDEVLNGYVEEALANNQDLLQAMYRVDQYIARLGIARSQLYPQLSATVNAGRDQISSTLQPIVPPSQALSDAYNLVLNLSFQTDLFGKIRSAAHAAKAQLLSQIQNRRTVVLTLVSSVVASYINIRTFDEQVRIAKETLKSRQESYYLAVVRFELGNTSEIEVEQAKAEVETAEIALERIELKVRLEEDLFAILLGKPPANVKRGKPLNDLVIPVHIPVFYPKDLFDQRPDILASEQELIAANANIGVARALFFPQIDIIGAIGTESSYLSQLFKGPSTVWQYGLTMLQEIFTGGFLTSNLRRTKAEKMEQLYAYESVVLNAFKEVNDALIAYEKTQQIFLFQRERVQTVEEYFYLATLRYNEGQIDYLTYLDAERQVFNAQLECAGAQGDVFVSLVDIYKSLGGGWVVDADIQSLRMNDR